MKRSQTNSKKAVAQRRLPFKGWTRCSEDRDCGECLDDVYYMLNKEGENLPADKVLQSIETLSCLSKSLLPYLKRFMAKNKSTEETTSEKNDLKEVVQVAKEKPEPVTEINKE